MRFIRRVFATKILLSGKFLLFVTLNMIFKCSDQLPKSSNHKRTCQKIYHVCINRILWLTVPALEYHPSLDVHSLWIPDWDYIAVALAVFLFPPPPLSSLSPWENTKLLLQSILGSAAPLPTFSGLTFVGRIHPTALFPTVLSVGSWETKNHHFPNFLRPDCRSLASKRRVGGSKYCQWVFLE